MNEQLPYRQCVVGVFTNTDGLVLAGERSDKPGQWQLPQGGIGKWESATEALEREMREELGTSEFRIISLSSAKTTYDFPPMHNSRRSRKFRGQEQTWFHLQFTVGGAPDLEKADGEFSNYKWMLAAELLQRVIAWKKDAYRQGLTSLGLL